MKIVHNLVMGISALVFSSVILASVSHQNTKMQTHKLTVKAAVMNVSKQKTVNMSVKKVAVNKREVIKKKVAINKKQVINKKVAINKKEAINKKIAIKKPDPLKTKLFIHKLVAKIAMHKNNIAVNTINHNLKLAIKKSAVKIKLATPAGEKKLAVKKVTAKSAMGMYAYAQSVARAIERQSTAARLDVALAGKHHEVITVTGNYS